MDTLMKMLNEPSQSINHAKSYFIGTFMQSHLSKRPVAKLLKGYHKARQDYLQTGKDEYKVASEIIKAELERRGIPIVENPQRML